MFANLANRVDTDFWDRNGYYECPRLFSIAQMDAVVREAKAAWDNRDDRVVVDTQIYSYDQPRIRQYIDRLSEDDRKRRFVLNDMYLSSPLIREICLYPQLIEVMRELMGKEPVLWQSLNFNWGTNQGLHQDTLYLPPPNERDMVAIWIALEDIHPDSGPLRYVPGSHKIPPYRFSTGKLNVVPDETPGWDAHIAENMASMGLVEQVNPAKKGDVFFWDAFLVHGGSDIKDFSRTRKSLVCHYYSLEDALAAGCEVKQEFGGHWVVRPPLIPR